MDNAFDADENSGGEFDFSPFIEREIHVSYWYRLFESCERKAVFFGELIVQAVDSCTRVEECGGGDVDVIGQFYEIY